MCCLMVDNVGCWCWCWCWLLEEGREEDRGDGQRHTLARLLARRFGPLDAETTKRLAAGTPEQMGHWTDALLTAGSLEEVFRLQ